jgi:hypothetical protein
MTELKRMGWAGHSAILTETRNAYNKFSLGNINEINLNTNVRSEWSYYLQSVYVFVLYKETPYL